MPVCCSYFTLCSNELNFVFKVIISKYTNITFFSPMAQQPIVGQGFVIIVASQLHSDTHHTQQDYSGRGIGPSQRPLSDNTQHCTRDKHPCPRRDSNVNPNMRRLQTHALDRAATGIGYIILMCVYNYWFIVLSHIGITWGLESLVTPDCHIPCGELRYKFWWNLILGKFLKKCGSKVFCLLRELVDVIINCRASSILVYMGPFKYQIS
jgi:hypothetical protein